MNLRKLLSSIFVFTALSIIVISCDDGTIPDPIYGVKPNVGFTSAQSGSDIYTFSFANSTTSAVKYNWDFGDGSSSSDANPTHTYAPDVDAMVKDGVGSVTYTVTLTATGANTENAMGWIQKYTETVTINLPTYDKTDITFVVDMSTAKLAETDKVYFNGDITGWCGVCEGGWNEMKDEDGDGRYEITIADLSTNTDYLYKYTLNGWGNQEMFEEGDACTQTNGGYTNRLANVNNLSNDWTLDEVCWNSCDECDGFSTADVTFKVDMSNYESLGAQTVTLNGSFNGWCGECTPMSDADGDGIWEVTVPNMATKKTYEYKFTIGNWAVQEEFTEGTACTSTIDGYTNRTLDVSKDFAEVELDVVCWNECEECS